MKRTSLLGALALSLALLALDTPARAVVQWARQYGMACEGCHTTYPRLNAVGIAFRQNGYRFAPEERAVLDARTLRDYIGPTWSPALSMALGKNALMTANGVKVHLGGPVGRSFSFLAQPTPGGAADFNMAQGMLTFGGHHDRFRLVGGRLYAWGNGGGIGASDRWLTNTTPLFTAPLHGVSMGGLGNGFRLEYSRDSKTVLALFGSDMEATAAHPQVYGVSFAHRFDPRSTSAVELFAAQAALPAAGKPDITAMRGGLLGNAAILDRKQVERGDALAGFLIGAEARPVKAGLPTRFWTGFLELDWIQTRRLTWVLRQEWENGAASHGAGTASTLGAIIGLNRNLRLDTDLILRAPGSSATRLLARLRMVY